jgi:hypothetical protein
LSIIGGHAVFKDKAWQHEFVYYDPIRNIVLGGRTAILTVELTKLDEIVKKPPEEMTRLERWAVYWTLHGYKDRRVPHAGRAAGGGGQIRLHIHPGR